MKTIREILTNDVGRVAIAGHVNPDGDCAGSCMALALYIRKNCPGVIVDVYLEPLRPELRFLKGTDSLIHEMTGEETCDLFILLDVSSRARIGVAGELFDKTARTVCIDHHIGNDSPAGINHIRPTVGSCAEVLAELLDPDGIDAAIAEALYTGIIHDTGVFQYSNTRPETLMLASRLIGYGFDFPHLIYDSFYARTHRQTRILGYCLEKSRLSADGRFLSVSLSLEEMARYGAVRDDIGEVVSQLKLTRDIEMAVFVYETTPGFSKVSLRSSGRLDANKTASLFGGGGHVMAAGCTLPGSSENVLSRILMALEREGDSLKAEV